jgi:hypothetical protein
VDSNPFELWSAAESVGWAKRSVPTIRAFVIARSTCDEAIQFCCGILDCFASLAMTECGVRNVGKAQRAPHQLATHGIMLRMVVGTAQGAFAHPTRSAAVRSLSKTAGKLFLAIEGARRGEAVRGDTTLPGKPLRTIRASPSAGYIRFGTASRQSAAASRRRSAELYCSAWRLGPAYKGVQLRSESRGEIRATNRTRLGFFCNAEYDRCGGAECYDDQPRNTHRIPRSQVRNHSTRFSEQ